MFEKGIMIILHMLLLEADNWNLIASRQTYLKQVL